MQSRLFGRKGLDTGGALLYRAQGGLKGAAFGDTITELASLRDPALNRQAASVFGHLTEAEIKASAARVVALDEAAIRREVDLYGAGDDAARRALADRLIARRADLIARWPDLPAKVADAQRVAEAAAHAQITAGLAEFDAKVLTAIRGISSRSAAGTALEAKDLARVAEAADHWQDLLTRYGHTLAAGPRGDLAAHAQTWLDRLSDATGGGVGAVGRWDATWGQFSGYTGRISLLPGSVRPEFAPWMFGGGPRVRSAAEVLDVLRATELGAGSLPYVSVERVPVNPANPAGAALFDTMPPEYKRVLWSWTPGQIYGAVNRELLSGRPAAWAKDYAEMLNDALEAAPAATRHSGVSTRGACNTAAEAQAYFDKLERIHLASGEYSFEGMASSTAGTAPAFSSKLVWITIHGKSGVKIADISSIPTEGEVLFGTRTRFRVTSAAKNGNRFEVVLREI